jgi:hypothetical protein
MRLVKGFIFVFVGVFIVISLFSLLIPSKVVITKGVVVNNNGQKVFSEVSNLQNWQHWLPVFKTDSVKLHFSPGNGLNSSCEWESGREINKLLIDSISADKVEVALLRPGENDVVNTIRIFPLADSNSVQVEWRAVTKLKWYPWQKFQGLFIEKMSGESYDAALNGLKAYVEGR